MSRPLKLMVAVHGRFHAFDLVRELIRLGVDVTLVTNYPRRVAMRFGVPPERVRSCLAHGIATRLWARMPGSGAARLGEPFFHRWFGRFAACEAQRAAYAVTHSFSGAAEEFFQLPRHHDCLRTLVRGSSHIRFQARLLVEEEARAGVRLDRPSDWMTAREIREYDSADAVFVLSSFARDSFLAEGCPADRVHLLLLGSEVSRFRPGADVLAERSRRVLSGAPLRVLTVGSFTHRKGAQDLLAVARDCRDSCRFRFVGDVVPETRSLVAQALDLIEFIPRQPQYELPAIYNWGDLFVFPTIEDGYAVVLAQAQAAGLPLLTTTNCAGPDLVQEGISGWVLPIRSPDQFGARLRWCQEHRAEVARMADQATRSHRPRDWKDVAEDYLRQSEDLLARRTVWG